MTRKLLACSLIWLTGLMLPGLTAAQPSAWLLIEEVPEGRVAYTSNRRPSSGPGPTSTPLTSASPEVAGSDEQADPPPTSFGEETAAAVDNDSAELPALLTDPGRNLVRIPPGPGGGVDATRDPIVLQQFAEDEVDIRIDGRLDEPVWSRVKGYDGMSVLEPDTLTTPDLRTVTRFIYTERGLYVGIWNEQPPDTLVPRLTRRDEYINRDGNHISLDTSGEGLYGLWFEVNLGGSMTDGKILPEMQFTRDWDGPWYGNAAETEDGYTTEFFLPWSMMAMPETNGKRILRYYNSRRVAHRDERWGWPALPMTGSRFMSGMQPLKLRDVNPRQQYAFYPFASSTHDNIDTHTEYRAGIDAFWRPSPNLQLTATLNPDFGTVESDEVVVNLTAFETFFSEKRLFFLEGSEIFTTTPRANPYGGGMQPGARQTRSFFMPTPTMLVNTRRIGGPALTANVPDSAFVSDVELNQPTDLHGAFKVTGQQGPLRYGVLGAFEDDPGLHGLNAGGDPARFGLEGRDFGVVRALYENSDHGRKALGMISTAVTHPEREAYVQGVDAHYVSPSSIWRADVQFMHSDVNDVKGFGTLFDLVYTPRRGLSHSLALDYLDEDLDINDFGFTRRNDLIALKYGFNYGTSAVDNLRYRSQSFIWSQEYNNEGRVVRSGLFWRNGWTFNNSMMLRTELNYFPERWDDRNSEGNGSFRIEDRWVAEAGIGTDSSKPLSVSLAAGVMQEELGGWTTNVKGGFTYKPNDRLSVDLDLLYQRRDGWLLHQDGRDFTTFAATNWQPGLSVDYFLSARQQLRFTLQWAGIRADEQEFYQVPVGEGELIEVSKALTELTDDFAISRITAQLRYRWEIAPLSDLFIVYTRGSNLVTRRDDEFNDYFHDALIDPLVDRLVIKLRYRFGS